MVPFYTSRITAVFLTLTLLLGRGVQGACGEREGGGKPSDSVPVETEKPEASATPAAETDKKESKIQKIDMKGNTAALPTEEPTPEPTPESTPEAPKNKGNGGNSEGSRNSGTAVQRPAQIAPEPAAPEPVQPAPPVQPVEPEPDPEPQQGDGYYPDQKSCVAAARGIGATNYSCTGPMDDGQWYLWWSK